MTVFQWVKARMGQFSQILAMRLYAAGAAFLVTLLLGRLLGPSEFGAYVYAMGWVSIFMLCATLGFPQYTTRSIPALLVRDKISEAKGLVVLAATIVTAMSLVIAVIALLNHTRFSEIPSFQAAVLIVSLLILPQAWFTLRTGILQGLGHPIAGQIPERLVAPTLMLLTLGACAVLSVKLTAREVLLIAFAVAILALLSGLPSLRRALRQIDVAPTFTEKTSWIAGAAKTSLAFAAAIVLSATDVIMLGLLSTPEETGVYGIAARFFLLMSLPFQAAIVHISQRAAKLNALGDTDGLALLAQGAANRCFLSSLALAVPSTIIAFNVELVFGPGFGPAMWPILILVWARVALSVAGQPGPILSNTEYVGSVAVSSVTTALINIALNAALIPKLGATGAAIATSASFVLMTIGHLAMLRYRLGILSFIGQPARAE